MSEQDRGTAGGYRSSEKGPLHWTLVVRTHFGSRAGHRQVESDLTLSPPSLGRTGIIARIWEQDWQTPALIMLRSWPPGGLGGDLNPQMTGSGLLLTGARALGPGPTDRYCLWKEGTLAGSSDSSLLQAELGSETVLGSPRLPDDAPLRLDAHDGGVLHVLEEQVLVDTGLVHLHHHLHLQHLL